MLANQAALSARNTMRIGAILHLDIANEAILAREYLLIPLSRRQNWLRQMLQVGFCSNLMSIGRQSDLDTSALNRLSGRTVRIQIHLDQRVDSEISLLQKYESLPRSRRGKWVVAMIEIGQQLTAPTPGGMTDIGALITVRQQDALRSVSAEVAPENTDVHDSFIPVGTAKLLVFEEMRDQERSDNAKLTSSTPQQISPKNKSEVNIKQLHCETFEEKQKALRKLLSGLTRTNDG